MSAADPAPPAAAPAARPGAVLLTGAGSGLGAALAEGLAAAGYPVVGLGRSAEALAAVAERAARAGGLIVPVTGDARDRDALERALQAAAALPGGLYGVIANAGIAGPTAPIQQVTDQQWQEVFETNVTAVYRLCALAAPRLSGRAAGRVVLIGSVTGKRPLAGRTPYAASKIALVGLARSLAVELGPDGTTVNVVSPWLVEGDRLDAVLAGQARQRGAEPEQVRRELVAGTATGSTVGTDDVLAAVEYLLDTRSGAITGQDLTVSAGAVMY